MSKVSVIAFLIAWILANINGLIWRKRAIDAEKKLKFYLIAIEGALNRRKGAEDDTI